MCLREGSSPARTETALPANVGFRGFGERERIEPGTAQPDAPGPPGKSGRVSLRVDRRKILLPDIVHGAVHRAHGEFFEFEQQILIEQ